MKILNWSWKNYKSFGGIEYTIELNPNKGELILLTGENGKGKSSSLTSLDVALYGTELNKRGTKLAKSNYPNRINNNLYVNAKVINDNNDTIEITRTMSNSSSPIKTKLLINGAEKTPAKLDDYINKELGTDFSTFKSFCSINVSYFKNFMSLTPEDKRTILDKMFNMQQINDLNKILKQLTTENTRNENSIKSKIETYKSNIDDLNESIINFVKEQEKKTDNTERLAEITSQIKEFETKYDKLLKTKSEIESVINEYKDVINKLNEKGLNYKRDIKLLNEKIELYNLGKCPTCSHDLTEELNLLPGLNEEVNMNNSLIEKIKNKIDVAKTELSEYTEALLKTDTKLRKYYTHITELKSEYKLLNKEQKEIDVNIFKNNISKMEKELEEANSEYLEIQKLKYIYDVLTPIWTDNGIKKRIIDSIITPINEFIKEDLERIKVPFRVELDDKFDAHVYELLSEIDTDSLSSGETRRINLIIMLAYIKMMRLQSNLNLLILDEVFTTIDINGIDEILYLLKEFATDSAISIFVVHHTELKEYFFDKVLSVEKPYFSILETKLINS